jgi:flagellar hook-length control protein FliK
LSALDLISVSTGPVTGTLPAPPPSRSSASTTAASPRTFDALVTEKSQAQPQTQTASRDTDAPAADDPRSPSRASRNHASPIARQPDPPGTGVKRGPSLRDRHVAEATSRSSSSSSTAETSDTTAAHAKSVAAKDAKDPDDKGGDTDREASANDASASATANGSAANTDAQASAASQAIATSPLLAFNWTLQQPAGQTDTPAADAATTGDAASAVQGTSNAAGAGAGASAASTANTGTANSGAASAAQQGQGPVTAADPNAVGWRLDSSFENYASAGTTPADATSSAATGGNGSTSATAAGNSTDAASAFATAPDAATAAALATSTSAAAAANAATSATGGAANLTVNAAAGAITGAATGAAANGAAASASVSAAGQPGGDAALSTSAATSATAGTATIDPTAAKIGGTSANGMTRNIADAARRHAWNEMARLLNGNAQTANAGAAGQAGANAASAAGASAPTAPATVSGDAASPADAGRGVTDSLSIGAAAQSGKASRAHVDSGDQTVNAAADDQAATATLAASAFDGARSQTGHGDGERSSDAFASYAASLGRTAGESVGAATTTATAFPLHQVTSTVTTPADAVRETGTAPALSTPFSVSNDADAQMIRSMRLQWSGAVGEAQLRLTPEHLGQVLVSVRVDQGNVSATLHADSATAQQWIQSHEGELRQALQDQGLKVAQFTVTANPDDRPRREQTRDDQPRDRQQARPRPQRQDTGGRTFEVRV